jgi:NhaP-type Na+/H+ and K+/H+ antiporters
VTGLCRRFNLAPPLVLIAVGIVASYLSFVPEVQLPAEVVLVGLLPPLLYSSALNTSLVEFKANRRPILMLSVGLVVFTTLGIGVLVHLLLPTLPWWAAFATGAVVAPPDAVAASAIGRRIGLPRSIVTVLEGESLFNDATALVALRTALAATISVAAVGLDFLIAAGGGTGGRAGGDVRGGPGAPPADRPVAGQRPVLRHPVRRVHCGRGDPR